MKKSSDRYFWYRLIAYFIFLILGVLLIVGGALAVRQENSVSQDIHIGIGTGLVASAFTGFIIDLIDRQNKRRQDLAIRASFLNRAPLDLRDIICRALDFYLSFKIDDYHTFENLDYVHAAKKVYEKVQSLRNTPNEGIIRDRFLKTGLNGSGTMDYNNFLFDACKCFIDGIVEESRNVRKNAAFLRAGQYFSENELTIIEALEAEVGDLSKPDLFVDFLDYLTAFLPFAAQIPEIGNVLCQEVKFENGRSFLAPLTSRIPDSLKRINRKKKRG